METSPSERERPMPLHITWSPAWRRWFVSEKLTQFTAVTYTPGERSDCTATATMICDMLNTDDDAHARAMLAISQHRAVRIS